MEGINPTDIKKSLRMQNVTLRDQSQVLLEKLTSLCLKYSYSADDVVRMLDAYILSNNNSFDLSLENFGTFEAIVGKEKANSANQKRNRNDYTTKSSTKRPHESMSPESNHQTSNKIKNEFKTPTYSKSNATAHSISASSSSFSSPRSVNAPLSVEGSGKVRYAERTNSGDIMLELNPLLGGRGTFYPSPSDSCGSRCEILLEDEKSKLENLQQRYRYMYTTLDERGRALEKNLLQVQETLFSELKKRVVVEDLQLQPVGIPSQDMVWVCGRICAESSDGKLDKNSVMLEGSRRDSAGRRILLDLVELKGYSLFPGQIVLVEGVNSSGRKMVARRVIEGFPNPLPNTPVSMIRKYHHSNKFQNNLPVNITIASGPFTTSDNLDYNPLRDLLSKLLATKPDVLVLVGPFVDISQPLLSQDDDIVLTDPDGTSSHGASYEMVFIEKVVRDCLQEFFNTEEDTNSIIPTKILLVPSLLDAHHEVVFPQPPFGDRDEVESEFFAESLGVLNIPHSEAADPLRRVYLLPNPCTFKVNEVVIGVTSNDVLATLSEEEINMNVPARLPRLAAHILQQQSYAPVFPPSAQILSQMDFRHSKYWHLNVSPDILILPSKLSVLAKEVLGTLVINPGQLADGVAGGTYAELVIHPLSEEKVAAVAEEGSTEADVAHDVCQRTFSRIIKI